MVFGLAQRLFGSIQPNSQITSILNTGHVSNIWGPVILQSHQGTSILRFVESYGYVIHRRRWCNNVASTSSVDDAAIHFACISDEITQPKWLAVLAKFNEGESSTLVATNVASDRLKIRHDGFLFNHDIHKNGKDYVHRIGDIARACRAFIGFVKRTAALWRGKQRMNWHPTMPAGGYTNTETRNEGFVCRYWRWVRSSRCLCSMMVNYLWQIG